MSKKKMFDFCIGNPPYQDDTKNLGDRPNPVYNEFMNQAYMVADVVELITPARFLFNAGQTPKAWNEEMLNDKHLKVLQYEADATKIFASTDIKGGVAITLRDSEKTYGAIGIFTAYAELNAIIKKVVDIEGDKARLNSIIASQGLYHFSDEFFKDYPEANSLSGAGTGNKIVSNIMEKLPDVFLEDEPKDEKYIKFLGRIHNKRMYRYILRRYIINNLYLDKYNLFLPEANNSGKFGETLTEATIGYPGEGSADTFLSAGCFATEEEPENLARYIKTKFFRAMLGVKKVTQHCPPSVWKMIPLQDFTSSSDIDWTKSIHEIDLQLYKKYGLSKDEINFIETNVKEMS